MRGPFLRRFGLPSPFVGDGFNPALLFSDGGNGILWDFTTTAPLFTDSAGTTPLTTAAQTIGMVRDGSRARSPATAYAGVQASAGLRPPYGIAPVSRRQLLTYSEDFSNAAWAKTAVTVVGSKVIPTAASALHELAAPQITTTSGATYRFSIDVTASGYDWLQVVLSTGYIGGGGTYHNFNVATGAVGTGNTTGPTIASLGGGVYRISVRIVSDVTTATPVLIVSPRPDDGARRAAFTGDGTSGVTIGRAMLEVSAAETTYQKSVTALEITETGFATYGYTRPDLVDDILSTVLTLAQTGDVMVFGRNGSWLETGRVYGAVATFSVGASGGVGPAASQITGLATLNILRAVGDVLGIVAMGRASTAAEQASAMAYFRARGAAGFLAVSGAELVTNGDFASGTTGWAANANATISNVANRLRITALAADPAAETTITTVIGQTYLLSVQYVTDAMSGNAFIYVGTLAAKSANLNLNVASTVGTYQAAFVATATTTYISISGSIAAVATQTMDWDNVSCKLLVAS